jgi:hypothetical protein
MSLDKTLSDTITALIEAHAAEQMGFDWQHDIAKRFGALAVYGDIGGALMLCPDGSILCAGWDEEEAKAPLLGWQIIGRAAASYHFPDLVDLAPSRPERFLLCWRCPGTGCAYCFGLGWLPYEQLRICTGAQG